MYENINVVEIKVKNGPNYFEAYHKRYDDVSASGSSPEHAVENLENVFHDLGYFPFVDEIGVLNELERQDDFSNCSELMYHTSLLRKLYLNEDIDEERITSEVYILRHLIGVYCLSNRCKNLAEELYQSVFYLS